MLTIRISCKDIYGNFSGYYRMEETELWWGEHELESIYEEPTYDSITTRFEILDL